MNNFKKVLLVTGALFCLESGGWAETLKVQVVDAKTGGPVQATVSAIGTLPRLESVRTDQEGVVVLDLSSLESVSAIVKTSTHGERCLGEEETKEGMVVVRMEPSLRVFGVVRDPSGNPLRKATVKLVYRDDPKCRIRFDRADEVTNERGEYVLRNVDMTKDLAVVVRHDLYAERTLTKGEILTAPEGPSSNTKEIDVDLVERP